MVRHRSTLYLVGLSFILSVSSLCYFLWQHFYGREFTCQANFVQHHPDETLNVWLTYSFNKESGILSMNGQAVNDPSKRFNRKIFFSVKRKNRIYDLTSEQHVVFPDDNVDERWLEKYEPMFFVYPHKNIFVRLLEQSNGNYLFIFSRLPAYVCHGMTRA